MKVQERPDTTSTIITNLSASIRQTGRERFYSLPCIESQKRGRRSRATLTHIAPLLTKPFFFSVHIQMAGTAHV